VSSARALPLGLAVVGLAGCFTSRPPVSLAPPEPAVSPAPPVSAAPPAATEVVPRVEPRSRYGNPPYYDVFGKRYYVLSSSAAYIERGVASWYGPGFHQVRTSTGETYDMYRLSAAHRTLPLPAYVLVTNLQNGRSVVVRVNDRGPFVANRIIDLSYAAASRLDMLKNGTAMVEVRAIDPSLSPQEQAAALLAPMPPPTVIQPITATSPPTPAAAPPAASLGGLPAAPPVAMAPPPAARAPLFVQAGAFSDPANADHLAAKLRGGSYGKIFVRDDIIAGRRMYRVRIGPVPNVPEFDRIVAALERAGVHDAHLALDDAATTASPRSSVN
jgi:rare lipoprotein A